MIPLNIEDPTVLRRTLEELEASIPVLAQQAKTVTVLEDSATTDEIIVKVNELVGTVNLLIATLNSTN